MLSSASPIKIVAVDDFNFLDPSNFDADFKKFDTFEGSAMLRMTIKNLNQQQKNININFLKRLNF